MTTYFLLRILLSRLTFCLYASYIQSEAIHERRPPPVSSMRCYSPIAEHYVAVRISPPCFSKDNHGHVTVAGGAV